MINLGKKLHKCSMCGHIGYWNTQWSTYGSLALQDERPDFTPRVCSDPCLEKFKHGMKAKTIIVPGVKNRGMNTIVQGEPIGYLPHPGQRELLEEYNELVITDGKEALK